nr:Gag-Pol polyprotein [Tanacetum cinerariifolium]
MRQTHSPFKSLVRWTKDHPIANIIGDPSRSVSTRKQLQTDAMWYYFDALLNSVELNNFKQAMTEPSWIDAIQEEIHEFKRLQVWELVLCLDKVMFIKLKWIYKVKTNKFGEVLRNKETLVAQGFRQEEELNNFKQAMTEPSWIDAIQEEIHEFERLQVWELVLCLDKVMFIKLKWIYKVKTNKFGEVLRNKETLVAQGFRQEEESCLPLLLNKSNLIWNLFHWRKDLTTENATEDSILEDLKRAYISSYSGCSSSHSMLLCILITVDVPVVYMHQFWDSVYKHDTFYIFKIDKRKRFKLNLEVFRYIFKIFPRVQGQNFDALPTNEEIMSFLRDLRHTGKSIYSMMLLLIRCINLRELLLLASTKVYLERQLVLTSFVSPEHKSFREETQINGAILPESLTSLEMKETQAYQTYLGIAIGAIPPKKAQKFKKPASPKLTIVPISTEAPMGKSKRVKRPAKNVAKIKPSATSEGTGVKLGVHDVAEEESSESEAESMGNDKDDSNNEQVSSDEDNDQEKDNDDEKPNQTMKIKNEEDEDDDEDETKIYDKAEGGEDEERDYSTSQLYDDVDIRLNEPVDTDEGIVQEEAKFLNFLKIPHTDAEIVSPMDVHVQNEIPSQQTPTLLTVPVLVILYSLQVFSTIIPQSFTPPPQQSTSTPPPTTEAINPLSTLPDFTSFFQFNNRLEKEVVELKEDDPLKTQMTALVDKHLDARLGTTRDEFMNFHSALITARITEQAVLAKEYSQPLSSYEAPAMLTEFELKKILIDKMDKSESYLAAPEHRDYYEGLKKSYNLDKTFFSTYGKVYSLKRSRKD